MMNKYLKSLIINRYIMCHTFFASMVAFYLLLVSSVIYLHQIYKIDLPSFSTMEYDRIDLKSLLNYTTST